MLRSYRNLALYTKQATNYHFPHSSNAEVNWIEHYKAQAQKSGQECAHYQKLYKRVSNENQSLKNQISILEQKIRKQEELDQQLPNNEELAEKLQLEVVQFRIDNASLKDEGKVLKKAIASIRDKKQVEILNFKLDQLYIDDALQKAEVASLQQEIAEVREEACKERVDHGHLEFEIVKRDLKIAAFDRITEARVEAESKLDRADSMIINLQEEIESAYTNYDEIEQELDARKKVVASLQQDLKMQRQEPARYRGALTRPKRDSPHSRQTSKPNART
jgi:chromosome segregation ATPase